MKRFLLFAILPLLMAASANDTVVRPKKDGANVVIQGSTAGGVVTDVMTVGPAGASLKSGVATKTADYTVTDTDALGYIQANTASGAVNITLPAPLSNIGRQITIEHKSGDSNNACILFNNASDTVDGYSYTTNFCLNDGDKVTLAAYAANQWKVVSYQPTSTTAQKNYVINGGINFSQRGSSYASTTSLAYGVHDRFSYVRSTTCGSGPSATYSTNSSVLRTNAKSNNTMQLTWGSGTCQWTGFRHKFEASNSYQLIGRTITLSFWVYFSTLAGLQSNDPVYVSDAAPSAVDTWTTSTPFGSGTARSSFLKSSLTAGQWKFFTTTWTVPATVGSFSTANGYGFDIYVNYDNSTSVSPTIYLGEIMLNEGPLPAPFQLAGGDIAGEFERCQRYYENGSGTATASAITGGLNVWGTWISYNASKRISAAPAFSVMQYYTSGFSNCPTPGTVSYTQQGFAPQCTSSGFSVGSPYPLSIAWSVNAEL